MYMYMYVLTGITCIPNSLSLWLKSTPWFWQSFRDPSSLSLTSLAISADFLWSALLENPAIIIYSGTESRLYANVYPYTVIRMGTCRQISKDQVIMPEKVWNIQNVALFRFLVSLCSSTVTCFYPVSHWPAECQACLPTESDHRWASCETFACLVPSGFQSSRSGQRCFVTKTMCPTWKGAIKAHYGWSQVHKMLTSPKSPTLSINWGLIQTRE